MPNDFEREFQGEFLPDQLGPLVIEYRRRRGEYDRTRCTGRRDGIAMPTNVSENAAIQRHALELRKSMFESQVEPLGFAMKEWERAIVNVPYEKGNRNAK